MRKNGLKCEKCNKEEKFLPKCSNGIDYNFWAMEDLCLKCRKKEGGSK